jgi:hypothetical protein
VSSAKLVGKEHQQNDVEALQTAVTGRLCRAEDDPA